MMSNIQFQSRAARARTASSAQPFAVVNAHAGEAAVELGR